MEPDYNASNFSGAYANQSEDVPGMAGMLIKWGVAKDKKTAETIMLIGSLILIAISIYIISKNL